MKHISKPSISLMLTLSVIIGIIAGAIISLSVSDEALSVICDTSQYIEAVCRGKWLLEILRYTAIESIWLFVIYALGFGAIYQPMCFLLMMLKGGLLGFISRGIFAASDVLASLAIILPSGVASIAVFYCAVRRAVNLSEAYFAMTVTNENRLGLKNEAADYTSAFFISILIIAIISAMRCLIICLLAG